MKTNTIYCGNNLEILPRFPEKSVDLIYADPPFFSNRHYEIIWNDGAEIRAFEDRWKGGISRYIGWMTPRLRECHRVLKDTGSMYLHCDWHANAHLRIWMDKIFGEGNFQNEIIWHYHRWTNATKNYHRMHDTLLYYTKSKMHCFNKQSTTVIPTQYQKETQKRGYATNTIKGKRQIIIFNQAIRGRIDLSKYDIVTQKSMDDCVTYASDVWDDIDYIPSQSKERLGYPTQKPEALLKRIIEASSNKDNIVLDPFCGCGTTIAVAQQLGRQWVGIDVSPTACRMMKDRLTRIGAIADLVGMPVTLAELKKMEPFAFQDWVINKIGGTHQNKKVDDKGIDGWTFLEHKPVQIKQSEGIGRNIIDNFQPAMERVNSTEGFIYAFSFTRSAFEEVARALLSKGVTIKLITIEELLQEKQ